jgi:hypothetical protein
MYKSFVHRRSNRIAVVAACGVAGAVGTLALGGTVGSATSADSSTAPGTAPAPSRASNVIPVPGPAIPAPAHVPAVTESVKRTARTTLVTHFEVFRRAAQSGEDSDQRQVTVGGKAIRLSQAGDQLCISIGTPSACGPIGLATTKPAVLAVEAINGSDTMVYGYASDDVAKVTINSLNGTSHTARPSENVYSLSMLGRVRSIEHEGADGSQRMIVAPGK